MYVNPYETMLSWLDALDGVSQDPRYHPEGDALFHSLQVFERALEDRAEGALIAAALLHDVGKATAGPGHPEVGATLLRAEPWVPPSTVWLVAHHLDLLRAPKETRAWHLGTPALRDLERLRAYDLGGRDPRGRVRSPEEAVSIVLETLPPTAHGTPA